MRRVSGDSGAVAVILALLLPVVLLGFGALVLDVGSLYAEKRQLQNGADSAAFAIATECAKGSCGAPTTTATTLAGDNANDGAANVEEVCGNATGLTPCSSPPTVPTGAGYVRVKTQTGTTDGPVPMPALLSKVFGATDNGTVHASSTVVWGSPAGYDSSLPMTISLCEFNGFVGTQSPSPSPGYASPLPSPMPSPFAWSSYTDRVIYLHDTTGATGCLTGPSGADNLSGGFGWLSTGKTDCAATTDVTAMFDNKTGVPPPSGCDPIDFQALLGTTVVLPIYDKLNALNGTNSVYHMGGYAGFVLTGYSINGQYKARSLVTGQYPCSGSQTCISGFFTKYTPDPEKANVVGGAGMGALVFQLLD